MSRGKQMLRELGHAVREVAKEGAEESARAYYFSVYDRGFNEAAQTCLGVLSDATEVRKPVQARTGAVRAAD
jgi:hypothetical protein